MGRKKLDICYVPQKAKRHGHFNRRIEGLFNKCHELSVICGVPLSLIIDGHKNSVFYENNCKGSSLDTIYAKTSGKVKMYDPETKKFLEIKKPQRTNKSVKPSARKFGNSVNVVEKGKKILVGEQTEGGPRSFVNTHDKYIQQANVEYWPELFNSGLHIFSSGKDMTNVKLHDRLLSQDTFIDAVPELNILDCSMQQGEVDLWSSELDCSSTWNIITDSEHYPSRGFSGGIFTPHGFQDNNATEIGEDDNGGTPILQSRANNLDGSVQEPREHSHHSSELLHYGLDHASSAALDITELDLIDHIFLSSLSPGGFPTAGGCRDNKFWKNYIEGLPYMECILGGTSINE